MIYRQCAKSALIPIACFVEIVFFGIIAPPVSLRKITWNKKGWARNPCVTKKYDSKLPDLVSSGSSNSSNMADKNFSSEHWGSIWSTTDKPKKKGKNLETSDKTEKQLWRQIEASDLEWSVAQIIGKY